MDLGLTLQAFQDSGVPHEIVTAEDGVAALDYLYARGAWAGRQPQRPVGIVLDIKMPRMDGLVALQRIKGDPGLRSIPVTLLTSSREERDLVLAYASGANSYIVKPLTFRRLAEVVRQIALYWVTVNELPSDPPRAVPQDPLS